MCQYIRNWGLDCTARIQLSLEVGILGSVAFILYLHIEPGRLDVLGIASEQEPRGDWSYVYMMDDGVEALGVHIHI